MTPEGVGRPIEILSADGTRLRCYRCREFQSFESFSRCRTEPTGRQRICKLCTADRRRETEGLKAQERAKRFARRYDISVEQYDKMFDAQGGRCAICLKTPEGEPYGVLSVDHDHTTNAVRGLLCRRCNLALGKMEDDPTRLMAAAAYLIQHTSMAVLA